MLCEVAGDGSLVKGIVSSCPHRVIQPPSRSVELAPFLGKVFSEHRFFRQLQNAMLIFFEGSNSLRKSYANSLDRKNDLMKSLSIASGMVTAIAKLITERKLCFAT